MFILNLTDIAFLSWFIRYGEYLSLDLKPSGQAT